MISSKLRPGQRSAQLLALSERAGTAFQSKETPAPLTLDQQIRYNGNTLIDRSIIGARRRFTPARRRRVQKHEGNPEGCCRSRQRLQTGGLRGAAWLLLYHPPEPLPPRADPLHRP